MATKASSPSPSLWQKQTAVQIHVALVDVSPEIWRRLVVPLDATLADLHAILQAAMGWTNSHLHEFDIGGVRYGDVDLLNEDRFADDAQAFDASLVRLRDFSRRPGTAFTYVYDFGDNWRHRVTLEQLVALDPAPKTATCIAGARCCPPEDVGGTGGYENYLDALFNPDPEDIDEQRHLKRWSGGRFDPERFDLDKTDKKVRRAMAPKRPRRRA